MPAEAPTQPRASEGPATGAPTPESVEAIATRLVGWSSVTGTPGEAAFAGRLAYLLAGRDWARAEGSVLRLIDSHGDPLTRSVVALVRGRGRETVLLAGHYDTVATDNYHDLSGLACDPAALRPALIADLSSRPLSAREARALDDLTSGDFLPGRGMLDMKSGIAAAIACLDRFAADPDRTGNLMLVITPDEERESRGMRSLRTALPGLAAELGLDIVAGLNLDVTSDQGDGRDGRSVYAGTIGKLLPFALVIGCSSHASYPFEGVSAAAIGAAILGRLEGSAGLADRDAGDVSPPPICLEAKDLRDGYEVTTPERFWIAMNWLYHAQAAEALFALFRAEVQAGAAEAVARFAGNAAAHARTTGAAAGAPPAPPRIVTLAELRQVAATALGADFATRAAAAEAALAGVDNPLTASRRMTEWLVETAGLVGPAVVIGFAGLHYPPGRLDPSRPQDRRLRDAIDAVRAPLADDPDRCVGWRPYFQGISDMSFLGQAAGSGDSVAANTPVGRLVDRPPADSLDFPVVNIGPWGREFHQRLERVHAPYAFGVLPGLILAVAQGVLSRAD
jgi:arginine utilization protein RocB